MPDTTLPQVVSQSYQFTLWLIQRTEKFPRSHRFTLGDRLEGAWLDIVEGLTHAAQITRCAT